ncbi:MAG: DUF1003 domain-containing protein [Chthonomonadales bacterium]
MAIRLRDVRPISLAEFRKRSRPVRNVNEVHKETLTVLERMAVFITEKVGTMGFFLIIFAWTVLWTGYNIVATEVPSLHWKAFDPFPAFVAYLLISNVIQILLMPLIMVGQNLQGRHSELRAENDFAVNVKAEQEIELILHHLEYQNGILINLVEKLGLDHQEIAGQISARLHDAEAPAAS